MSPPGQATSPSAARRRISLRGWALLTVAIVAAVGSIYGASIGARRSIHHAAPPAVVAHPPARTVTAHGRLLPVTAAVAAIISPGAHRTFGAVHH